LKQTKKRQGLILLYEKTMLRKYYHYNRTFIHARAVNARSHFGGNGEFPKVPSDPESGKKKLKIRVASGSSFQTICKTNYLCRIVT
jgi:hypothetical protein